MRALAVTIGLLALALVAGCSSHEPEFEDRVPAPPVPPASTAHLADAAARIALLYRDDVQRLPADALAPLTQASALAFRASGAPGLRTLTHRYADMLLQTRLSRARGSAFFGSDRPNRADAAVTAASVDALVDAFLATRDSRYRDAAAAGAAVLTSPSLGLRRAPGGLVFRDPPRRGRGRSIALTAQVARALRRAADPLVGASTGATSVELLGAVATAQEGLGRWYSFLGGRVPMNMERWATTLLSVASTPGNSKVEGVADAGVPALFETGFTKNGKPDTKSLPDPGGRGAALAISVFDAWRPEPTYARLVTQRALERRREDGTVTSADRDDVVVQALYAAGFARRALSTRRRIR